MLNCLQRKSVLAAQLAATNARLDHLTRTVAVLSEQLSRRTVEVTVQHMQVDRPALDSLIFRLEHLDVQELSGSLNLGNNFGIRSEQDATVERDPLNCRSDSASPAATTATTPGVATSPTTNSEAAPSTASAAGVGDCPQTPAVVVDTDRGRLTRTDAGFRFTLTP